MKNRLYFIIKIMKNKTLQLFSKYRNIKKFILFIGIIFLFGCVKEDAFEPSTKIVLLQVDYMTHVFEGGKELLISSESPNSDTIPISVDYKPPGDVGSIALYYQPNSKMIFEGIIVWMGTGRIRYPENFLLPTDFNKISNSISLPNPTRFQTIFNYHPDGYGAIWGAINKLEIVEDYIKSNKKIGLFLYTPGVGFGDPAKWDWFVILSK